MEKEEYELEEVKIKTKCRTKTALILGGLTALLIGGKSLIKNLDVDVNNYLWIQYPVYLGIIATTNYYGKKEAEKLTLLDRKYLKDS